MSETGKIIVNSEGVVIQGLYLKAMPQIDTGDLPLLFADCVVDNYPYPFAVPVNGPHDVGEVGIRCGAGSTISNNIFRAPLVRRPWYKKLLKRKGNR